MRQWMIVIGLLLNQAVVAGDVYRWTDAAGRVHFSERLPAQGAPDLERTQPPQTRRPRDPETTERRRRQRKLLDAYAYERARKQDVAADAAEAQRKADRRCRELRRLWRRLSHAGPIYESRPDGERRYLNDEERAAEKARLRPHYTEACGEAP